VHGYVTSPAKANRAVKILEQHHFEFPGASSKKVDELELYKVIATFGTANNSDTIFKIESLEGDFYGRTQCNTYVHGYFTTSTNANKAIKILEQNRRSFIRCKDFTLDELKIGWNQTIKL
jgi:hypothetical protein